VDLKDGQSLFIESPVEQSEFAALLAKEAYAMGCSDVGFLWRCDTAEAARLRAGCSAETHGAEELAQHYAQMKSAFLRLECPDLNVYEGVSIERLSEKARQDSHVRSLFRTFAAGCGQTIACVPGMSWANAVYPELPENERLKALWDAVLYCTRCDAPDPEEAWREYLKKTAERKKMLGERGYTTFHYHDGDGTDLTVSPAEKAFWMGSCIPSPERTCVPNIPTEEVFLTPHKYKVNGTIRSTKPLNYKGTLIEGIRLKFENGRIVEYSAEKGGEMLASIIETDVGSHYIGEMAFVDESTPIAQLGRLFYTTLYDENASCHIAIGSAIGPVSDPKEREMLGMNSSQVHVDFMVGSSSLCIDGLKADGTWESVFIDGHWAI
jgi:aminopeptidase